MKNKKILGALAALCMGIILCVSSVFAVNYWYSINNGANQNVVATGRAITLSLADGQLADDATGLYPGGSVTFTGITVEAPDWDGIVGEEREGDKTSNVENIALPTFKLIISAVTVGDEVDDQDKKLNDMFTVETLAIANGKLATGNTGATVAKDVVLIDNLQAACNGDNAITITIVLRFNEKAHSVFANGKTLKFSLAIVEASVFDAEHDTNISTEPEIA